MKKTIISSLIGLTFATPIYSAENIQLDDIVVSATRFNEPQGSLATNINIITNQDIQLSPATNIPDLLRMQSGLNVTSLYGNEGIDATVDVRGFGDVATNNTLILLDGLRLNGVDSSSIQWATIPLKAIDHIEIIPGGGSVLFGDRASGGVVNIITDKSGRNAASATASVGSYGYKSLDGYVSGNISDAYFNSFIHTADSNGWRQNSASNSWAVSGRGGINFNANEAFVDYSVYRIANGLPGSVNSATFGTNPRSARTPFDTQTKDGFRIRPGLSLMLTDNLELASEFSFLQENQKFNYVSFASTSDRQMKTFSVTPRVKWSHDLGQLKSNTVFGFDYYHGKVTADYHGSFGNQDATQTSQALYAENNTELTQNLNLNLGLRRQHVKQVANQAEYLSFGFPVPAVTGNAARNQNAYDLGITYHQPSWGAYAKAGRSFRFANTDELFGFDPITFQPTFFGDIIKPQTALNYETGINFHLDALSGKAALYTANVSDEIGFDSTQQINTNLDSTRHQGIETELSWQMLPNLKTKVSYTYDSAEFRNGLNKGNTLPSVPQNSAHAQLLWDRPSFGKYVAQLNYVGERRTVGDFANTLNKLPSFTTLDLRANWEIKQFTISLNALNVTDKKYSQTAIFSSFKNDYFYYPSNGRTFYLSASYDFK